MSFRSLLIALTFLAVFAMALRISADSDTWWQLRTGEEIVRSGQVPTTDSFSHTRNGEPWLYPSAAWLSQVQLYTLMEQFGFAGLNLWTAALVTLAFGLLYAGLSGGVLLRAFVIVLAAAASAVYWAARPYLWSFVFTAAFLWLLEAGRSRPRLLLWLPLVMLLWVNSHPGFAAGFILLAIYAVDFAQRRQGLRELALAAGGMLLAACINPSGVAMLRYPFDTVSMDVLHGYIQEWQSPNFHETRIWPFVALAALTLLALALSRKRPALYELLLLGVFGGMSLLAARNIALFSLAAPIVLARYAAPLLAGLGKRYKLGTPIRARPTRTQGMLHVLLLLAALAAVAAKAARVLPTEANWAALRPGLPVGAVETLQAQQPDGALFNSYNWGGYLVWALREYPVFADGRTDLYGDELLGEWLRIANAEPGWQAALVARNARLVLLEPGWALSKLLPAEGWRQLYADETSVLFERSE